MKKPSAFGLGKFSASKSSIEALLKELNILEDRSKTVSYPSDMPAILRKLNYNDMWRYCIDNKLYDFRLADHSLVQLVVDPEPSYSFLDAPFIAMTFEEFAHSAIGDDWRVLADDLRVQYEEYLSSEVDAKHVTPVRYDYSERTYRKGVHPAGHLHFGLDNQVRVGTRRVMSPISFILFVVRQFYPRQWERVLVEAKWKPMIKEVRELADEVSVSFFGEDDQKELYLL